MPSKEREKKEKDRLRKLNKEKDPTVTQQQNTSHHFLMIDAQWQQSQCNRLHNALTVCHKHKSMATAIPCGIPLHVQQICGDGNCFFRALSYCLTGNELQHLLLRSLTIEHMKKISDIVEVNFLNSRTLENYLSSSQMPSNSTWATEVEIYTAAHMLNTNIYIYSIYAQAQQGHQWKWLLHSPTLLDHTLQPSNRSIYLYHRNQNHYDVVLSVLQPPAVRHVHPPVSDTIDLTSRKEYQMMYMRKKRETEESFREIERVKERTSIAKRRLTVKYREEEKIVEKIGKSKRRSDEDYRKKETEKETQRLAIKRKKSDYRMNEKETEKIGKMKRRTDKDYRKKEIEKEVQRIATKRKKPEYRSNEKKTEQIVKTKKRTDRSYRKKEIEIEKNRIATKRKKSAYRSNEKKTEQIVKTKKRADKDYRKKEIEIEKKRIATKRKKPEYRINEKKTEQIVKTKKRADKDYRKKEIEIEIERIATKRKRLEYRMNEKKTEKIGKTKRRTDKDYRKKEIQKEIQRITTKRKRPAYRIKERETEKSGKSRRREDKLYHEKEIEEEKKRLKRKRENKKYREQERKNKKLQKNKTKSDMAYIQKKRVATQIRMRKHRSSAKIKYKHKLLDPRNNHKKMQHRKQESKSKQRKHRYMTRKKKKRKMYSKKKNKQKKAVKCAHPPQPAINMVISNFLQIIKTGPDYVCACCWRLMYRSCVVHLNRHKYSKLSEHLITSYLNHEITNDKEWVCTTCHNQLKKGNMPAQSQANKLSLPKIPETLSRLFPLEIQLIAKIIPFMKIVAMPRGAQHGIKGQVVLVPADLNKITTALPRSTAESQIISLALKRRLSDKSHVLKQYIRPEKVTEALNYLKKENKCYSDIAFDSNWETKSKENNPELWDALTFKQDEETIEQIHDISGENSAEILDSEDEVEEENPLAITDELIYTRSVNDNTCIQPVHGPDIPPNKVLNLAPGEGQYPTSRIKEPHWEAMAFPKLFPTGTNTYHTDDPRSVKITEKKYVNSRLLSKDTRFSESPEYAFQALDWLERQAINQSISITTRKKFHEDITVAQLQNPQRFVKLLSENQLFATFRNIRGTPQYWKNMQLDMLAKLRQYGPYTFFLTGSAAEFHWPEVIQIVARQYGEYFTEQEIKNMNWQTKKNWLQRNPVTVARHIDFIFQQLWDKVILSGIHPVGQILNFDLRKEMQGRGTAHFHAALHVKNAPVLDKDSDKAFTSFADKYISCSLPDENAESELFNLVISRQRHHHTRTCKKKKGVKCRFSYPRPPSTHTGIYFFVCFLFNLNFFLSPLNLILTLCCFIWIRCFFPSLLDHCSPMTCQQLSYHVTNALTITQKLYL